MNTWTWQAGSGRFFITFTSLEQCRSVTHPGPCDLDVAELAKDPAIAAQLAMIDPVQLREELNAYGTWDKTELADHAQNLQRFLWLAAGDVAEEPETYVEDVCTDGSCPEANEEGGRVRQRNNYKPEHRAPAVPVTGNLWAPKGRA